LGNAKLQRAGAAFRNIAVSERRLRMRGRGGRQPFFAQWMYLFCQLPPEKKHPTFHIVALGTSPQSRGRRVDEGHEEPGGFKSGDGAGHRIPVRDGMLRGRVTTKNTKWSWG
jgi:hypothetical protein